MRYRTNDSKEVQDEYAGIKNKYAEKEYIKKDGEKRKQAINTRREKRHNSFYINLKDV